VGAQGEDGVICPPDRKHKEAAMRCCTTILLLCLLNGACAANPPDRPSQTDPECFDPHAVARGLRVEDIYDSKDGLEAATKLLKSLDIELLQETQLRLDRADRISGKCVEHLDHFQGATYRFDTGVILADDFGVLVPFPEEKYRWSYIGHDDEHPDRAGHPFVKAVELGTGLVSYKGGTRAFVGIWEHSGKSVITPYRRHPYEEWNIYNDLIASKRHPISVISFFPAMHGYPAGAITILLQDGDDRISLTFEWSYDRLFRNSFGPRVIANQ